MTNQELNDLLASFEESSLSKLKLSTQEFTIEMERAVSAPAAPVIPAAAAAPAAPAAAEPEGDAITAPMVGTFYAASAPEQPPFVKVGDRVRKGSATAGRNSGIAGGRTMRTNSIPQNSRRRSRLW